MANTNINLICGSLATLLNNSAVIAKPFSTYNGSLFFGVNQEFTLRSSYPVKGRIRPEPSYMENKSFGTGFGYDKIYNIFIDFYAVRNAKADNGLKDYELVNDYLQKIEDAIVDNSNTYGPVTIINIGEEEAPALLDDAGNNVIGGTKMLVLRERRNG